MLPRFPLLLPLLLAACQEPFQTDRHDLRTLRIAALGVHDGVASAAIWSGLGPWHDARPTLEWSLDGVSIGEGYAVTVPDTGTLSLLVTDATGDARRADVSVVDRTPALAVSRASVDIGEDVSLEGRRALEATEITHQAPSGSAVRMTLSGVPDGASGRWMSAVGTVLELEVNAADLIPEEIRFDDGEIEHRASIGDGFYPGLVLVADGGGGNDWLWVDAVVGEPTDALVRHQGRLIPADDAAGPGLIAATLVEDPVQGVRLEAVESVADASQQEPLDCMPDSATVFALDWIATGRCPRPDVLGARIVLETW